jgi:hypothetical protein
MLDEHRTTQYQVRIVDVIPSGCPEVGDLALVQFYEWMVGGATNRRLIPLRELATERWILFADMEDANDYYTNVASVRDKSIRARREEKKQ